MDIFKAIHRHKNENHTDQYGGSNARQDPLSRLVQFDTALAPATFCGFFMFFLAVLFRRNIRILDKFIVIANDDLSYVIDERTKKLFVCTADAKDIIRGCIRNFVAYMDAWANFDIEENGGVNQINYMRDFLDRKALIESAEDEINPYLMGPKI